MMLMMMALFTDDEVEDEENVDAAFSNNDCGRQCRR